ncbi:3-mercaptopyruvate sulfurtransferase [Qingshengfaniella alkalisoli]|uniref:3-mercaptopyruvate sulfurtransferase n=1 Tax=Qingshengfaniella alkalisoli TaxID=2599296 RepID=A0A5B8J6C6_9RHOB|nr:3-mercaptopyruvate sulfurtransferase [Qingshengfaniella alkalisoli]QDY69900.1 3-mercaptopyruvate sulfurtransferase [Qingshengfaniella alkalisoli]
MNDDPNTLVSAGWLASKIGDGRLRIIDASWYLPTQRRDTFDEFMQRHIPGAVFFDIDAVSDPNADSPHMAPSPEIFADYLRAASIDKGDQVVVYDSSGLFSAARVWWLFRLMGHESVGVLDGGLPAWIAAGQPVESGEPSTASTATATSGIVPSRVADMQKVAEAIKDRSHEILDARPPNRFRGDEPEPRPGLRAGHMPGAKNVFFRNLLNDDGTMKTEGALRKVFSEAGADLSRPVITTCGSGVTAAIISLALERIGKSDYALYDGSWSEWGMHDELPIATGAE